MLDFSTFIAFSGLHVEFYEFRGKKRVQIAWVFFIGLPAALIDSLYILVVCFCWL